MTREEAIKSLKYTKEKHKNDKANTFGTNITLMCEDILKVLDNCIEIPEGATNGDIIEAVFPNVDKNFSNVLDLNLWWNASYKKNKGVNADEKDSN